MSKLKLSDWASIAEILASVVVIASLAYIGLELRQNTQAMQQASYQSANDYLLQMDLAQATDAELNRLMLKAESTPADVTEEEWERFKKMAYSRYGLWEFVVLADQEGAINSSQLLVFEPYFIETACEPGYVQFWADHSVGFAPIFQQYMEREVLPECWEK
jgi:hypothetical protein